MLIVMNIHMNDNKQFEIQKKLFCIDISCISKCDQQ